MTRSFLPRFFASLALAAALAAVWPARAHAEPIYISYDAIRKYMRWEAGAGNWNIGGLAEPVGSRSAWGLHLGDEVRMVSAFMDDKPGLTAWDSFFFDLQMGKMTSTKVRDDDSALAIGARFGYQLQLGWRTDSWAAYGGVRYQYSFVDIGGSDLSGGSWPAVVRGEYKLGERRFIGQLWGSAWGTKSFGAQVDLPIASDYYFLTARYARAYLDADVIAYGLSPSPTDALYGTQVFIGIRGGNPL